MRRREFIQWATLGSMAVLGLPGCGGKSSADVGIPPQRQPAAPPTASVASSGNPAMVVVNGADPDDLIERGLQAMGGIGRFVKSGQSVVIKPNFSVPRTPDQAATTNPMMVAALVKRCQAAGAKSVKTCVLVDKTWRESEVRADYVGFHATRSVFLAGYGLDDGTGFGRVLDHLVKSTPKD